MRAVDAAADYSKKKKKKAHTTSQSSVRKEVQIRRPDVQVVPLPIVTSIRLIISKKKQNKSYEHNKNNHGS